MIYFVYGNVIYILCVHVLYISYSEQSPDLLVRFLTLLPPPDNPVSSTVMNHYCKTIFGHKFEFIWPNLPPPLPWPWYQPWHYSNTAARLLVFWYLSNYELYYTIYYTSICPILHYMCDITPTLAARCSIHPVSFSHARSSLLYFHIFDSSI